MSASGRLPGSPKRNLGSTRLRLDDSPRTRPSGGTEQPVDTLHSLEFVEGDRFHALVGSLIGTNVLVLAIETDYPHWAGWPAVDVFFAMSFLIEIVLRMSYRGVVFFFQHDTAWGMLDLVIVVQGVFDSIIEPALQSRGSFVGAHSSASKFVRLLRLLRMLRIVRLYPRLMSFAEALVEMFGTMLWIFSILTVLMLVFAIAMTREIGHGQVQPSDYSVDEDEWEKLREYFQDVPTAMFTLFRVSTQDDWMTIAGPLVTGSPSWSVFFVVFIVFFSWTMISVLTAVASESMVAATTDRKEHEMREAEQQSQAFIEFLREAFMKADSNHDGTLDKGEFDVMMQKDSVGEQLQNMGFAMTEDEIVKAWEMLDIERQGGLTIDSFVSGLSYLQEKLTTRHVMNISYLVKRVSKRVEKSVEDLTEELDVVTRQSSEIVRSLDYQDQLREQQQMSLWLWYQWMQQHDPKGAASLSKPARPARLDSAATDGLYDL